MWRSLLWETAVLSMGTWLGMELQDANTQSVAERCDTEVIKLQIELNDAREAYFREKAAWENEKD